MIESLATFEKDIYNTLYNAYLEQFSDDMKGKKVVKDAAKKFASTASPKASTIIFEFLTKLQITVNTTGSAVICPPGPMGVPPGGPAVGIITSEFITIT